MYIKTFVVTLSADAMCGTSAFAVTWSTQAMVYCIFHVSSFKTAKATCIQHVYVTGFAKRGLVRAIINI